MKTSLRFFCLVALLATSSLSAAVNLVVSGGALRDAGGAALPTGSLAVVVASTQDNVFQTPPPLTSLQVGAHFGSDDVVLAVFPVGPSQTATNGGFVGVVALDYAALGIPNLGAGDRLTLYWFPAASLVGGNQIATNANYGAFRSDTLINRSNGVWLAPDDSSGGSVELNFFTQAIGGESDNTLALASNNVATGSTIAVTIQTSPAGRTLTVDGIGYGSAQLFNWTPGSSHTIATTGPQSGGAGVQYPWTNWSDGGSISHVVSPTVATTYTANFSTQFLLTTNAGAGGTVGPVSGWYNAGQSVAVAATANSGASFTGWSGTGNGSYTGSNNPVSVTMNGPITQNASFTVPGGDTAFVTSVNPGPLRQDFSGWVGMQVVVGPTAISVKQVGRLKAPGNTGTHLVKLVDASTGADVPGGAATVSMNAGVVGQFSYATLNAPVTLAAGGTYFIVSQETQGSDAWHEYTTVLTTTNVANDVGVVWGSGNGVWNAYQMTNRSYVPVDIKYGDAVPPVPTITYVTGVALGSLRNDFSGWVGMQIAVGATPINITQLGRIMGPGNSGMHLVKLVDATTGVDVPGGSTLVSTTGGSLGQFCYATLTSPVTLAAGATYFIVSQETQGGDLWYEYTTSLTTTSVANDIAVVWGSGNEVWNVFQMSNHSWVPVDFKYSDVAVLPPAAAYVTGVGLGPLRNDFSGWVGMQVAIGSNPITVRQLGRMTAPGNSGTHAIKLVDANSGNDVPGGSAGVSMADGRVGQFTYATLNNPVTLAAGGSYFIVSQEGQGGDSWHEYTTSLTTTAVANDVGVVWGSGSGIWNAYQMMNRSYVPVDFKYGDTTPPLPRTPFVTSVVLGPLRTDFSGWVGMQVVVGATPISVKQLGRMMAPGNAGTHVVKLVNASTGLDVPGGRAVVLMGGGTVGQFSYATLNNPVILAAGGTYFVVSEETQGGDSWHEYTSALTTTNVARDEGVVWGNGLGLWNAYQMSNRSYVPVDFKY